MTSKLLHAIVGVGIAFGAGCGGSSTESETANDEGSPGPPTCTDPKNECDPVTRLSCSVSLGGLRCDYERHSAFCVDGAWLCHPDQADIAQCRCFGEIPPGMVCTETGWAPTSPG
jgi:hypothetical protein